MKNSCDIEIQTVKISQQVSSQLTNDFYPNLKFLESQNMHIRMKSSQYKRVESECRFNFKSYLFQAAIVPDKFVSYFLMTQIAYKKINNLKILMGFKFKQSNNNNNSYVHFCSSRLLVIKFNKFGLKTFRPYLIFAINAILRAIKRFNNC